MNKTGSLYIERESLFHRLQGSTKLLMLLCWTIFIFMFMDIRIFLVMTALGFCMIKTSKIPFKSIKPLVYFVMTFTVINSLILILITPQYGSELTNSYTNFINIGGRGLTYETIFFSLTLSLKYISILPITLLFVFTTHPSRFASNLNRIGVPYKIAYAVNIALRYIPDVAEEMKNIRNSQEARGVAFSRRDAGIFKRLKNYMIILLPLLISSLNRIEVVSNAMDLRGFGRHKHRTWYNRTNFGKADYILLGLSILMIVLAIILKVRMGEGFWYPF